MLQCGFLVLRLRRSSQSVSVAKLVEVGRLECGKLKRPPQEKVIKCAGEEVLDENAAPNMYTIPGDCRPSYSSRYGVIERFQ
jgi:hypothetical protein